MPWRDRRENYGREDKKRSSSPNTLGTFESWRGAHERTIADDVVDKFSEVLRAAKTVTNDLLGRPRVPPPSM